MTPFNLFVSPPVNASPDYMLTTKVQKGEVFRYAFITNAPFNLSPLVDAAAEDMLPSLALSCQGEQSL